MKLPKIESVYRLQLPRSVDFSILRKGDTFLLVTNALDQPTIELYPKLRIHGDLWRYQVGNKLIEIEKGKERLIECKLPDCDRAWEILYAKVDEEVKPIVGLNGRYVFEGRTYSTLIRRGSAFFLKDGKDSVILLGGKEILVETPLMASFTSAGLSLIYSDKTVFLDWKGEKRNFNFRGVILHLNEGDLVYKNNEDAIIKQGKAIGICRGDAEVILSLRDRTVLGCDKTLSVYYNAGWINLSNDFDLKMTSASENYVAVANQRETIIYDMDLNQLFKFEPCVTGVGLRKGVLINDTYDTSIIDLIDTQELSLYSSGNGEGKLKVPNGYSISSYDLITLVKENSNDRYIRYILQNFGRDSLINLSVSSPFMKKTVTFKVNPINISVKFDGTIYCATQGGISRSGEGNCVLMGTIKLSKGVKSPSLLTLELKGNNFALKLEPDQLTTKVIRHLFIYESRALIPLKITLSLDGKEVFTSESVLPIVRVDPPNEWRREVRDLGHVRVTTMVAENELFIWQRKRPVPTFNQKVIVGKGSCTKVRMTVDENGRPIMSVSLGNPVEDVSLKVEGNYLIVDPKLKAPLPIQVYYATSVYTGMPAKIIFPLDPVYNKVILRVFAGNTTFQKDLEIDSFNLTLNTALRAASTLKEELESIGIL